MKENLTAARAREVLNYDPSTGLLTWRIPLGARAQAGAPAGKQHDGRYLRLMIDGRSYKAHRVIFLWMTGRWPTSNAITATLIKPTTWSNLREATMSQNGANRGPQVNNKSGVKGVFWNERDQKWIARIKFHQKNIWLGSFDKLSEASSAYRMAADRYFGQFARAA